jgi:hypothetical protein
MSATGNSRRRRSDADAFNSMIVTGAQAAGAKSLGGVVVTGVDSRETTRAVPTGETVVEQGVTRQAGDPEPVVFPREGGLPMDTRPSDLRQQRAAQRYREDGGDPRQQQRRK